MVQQTGEKTSQETQDFYPRLIQYLQEQNINHFDGLEPNRISILDEVVSYLKAKPESDKNLIFICTHNSRRSQLSQTWSSFFSQYYGVAEVSCFSGGTEVTAFHPNAAAALEKAGFTIQRQEEKNAIHHVFGSANELAQLYSKKYDDLANPSDQFAAIMTCSDADESCPFIPGAEARIKLTYEDPKSSDNTSRTEEVYEACSVRVAREMAYIFSRI